LESRLYNVANIGTELALAVGKIRAGKFLTAGVKLGLPGARKFGKLLAYDAGC
jgi:hypothetical protein